MESLVIGMTDLCRKIPLQRFASTVSRAVLGKQKVWRRHQVEGVRHLMGFAIDRVADAVLWVEADGQVCYGNLAACSSLGYTQEELLELNFSASISGEHPEEWLRWWSDTKTLGTYASESMYTRKDGTTFPVEVRGHFLEDTGREYLCLFARNISGSRRLEQQLVQVHKMEAIGSLAGGIAHDFNNILTAMMGFAELIKIQRLDEDRLQDYANHVLLAGERAKALIVQLLNFCHDEVPKQKVTNLESLILEVLEFLRAALPANIQIDPLLLSKSPMVMADHTQLYQVVMNLGSNAEHAMRETGGTLRITLDDVTFDVDQTIGEFKLLSGTYLRLMVCDTGHGITQEDMGRIFDPFYTTKKIGQGTGIGLAIVHGIIVNHGGAIDVESTCGQGTTFTIYLPRLIATDGDSSTHLQSPPLPFGRGCILFVDDEEDLAYLGRELLEFLGYEPVIRRSSQEALETFRSSPTRFDAVVTDQTMPYMTGVDLAIEIRQIRPDIPIILCTGYSSNVNEAQAIELGITAFLMKPVLSRDLACVLSDVVPRTIS